MVSSRTISSRTRDRSVAALACLVACGDSEARAIPVVQQLPAHGCSYAHTLTFADRTSIRDVTVVPERAKPGDIIEVSFAGVGNTHALQVGLLAPRSVSRQEVRLHERSPGFVDAREQWIDVEVVEGRVRARLQVPSPWHAASAILAVRASSSGGPPHVIDGPRTEAGLGLIGLVPVERMPTHAKAPHIDMGAIVVDGNISDWTHEPYTLVASVDGEPIEGDHTRIWFAWDQLNLYVAAQINDVDVWGSHRQHDDPLYQEEPFELFVAGLDLGRYLEYEVSAHNVTFDARFGSYRKGEVAWNSAMSTAVRVDGTLDARNDRDEGWTLEIALPWTEMCENTAVTCPPRAGMTLRVNTFRIELPRKGAAHAQALSPTHAPDFHAWQNAAVLELEP